MIQTKRHRRSVPALLGKRDLLFQSLVRTGTEIELESQFARILSPLVPVIGVFIATIDLI